MDSIRTPQTVFLDSPIESTSQLPEYRLFTPNAVFGAAIIGGPIGAGLLMGINYKRMGNTSAGNWAIAWGFIIMALAMPLGFFVPSWAQFPCSLFLALGMKQAALSLQGKAVDEHIEKTGMKASGWAAFGIGLIGMLIACAMIAVCAFAYVAITNPS